MPSRADAALADHWSEAARVFLNGDLPAYAALARHTPDFTLTPPYGGDPRVGFDESADAVERTARTFLGGAVELEVFATHMSDDLAVLVAVERQHGTVVTPPSQEWSLRVTLVFRRDDDGWQLVHRHADPLTRPIDHALFAAIARGDHAAS